MPKMQRLAFEVMDDVRKALKKEVSIVMKEGHVTTYPVAYENIPLFCYGCRVIGHRKKDCEYGPYEEAQHNFGPYMKASPWKPIRKMERSIYRGMSLSIELEEEQKRREEEEVNEMIRKLQEISVKGKNYKKQSNPCNRGKKVGEHVGGSEGRKTRLVVQEQGSSMTDSEEDGGPDQSIGGGEAMKVEGGGGRRSKRWCRVSREREGIPNYEMVSEVIRKRK